MQNKDRVDLPKSAISPDGQITLPESVMEALSLKPGDQVRYFILEGEVRILPVLAGSRLFGSLRYDGPPKSLEDMDEAITQKVRERARR